jgi:hypothetical protein
MRDFAAKFPSPILAFAHRIALQFQQNEGMRGSYFISPSRIQYGQRLQSLIPMCLQQHNRITLATTTAHSLCASLSLSQ